MVTGDTRTQKHPLGIVPGPLGEIERVVPADEAPPLPPNTQLEWIGKPVPRVSGRAKVTGAVKAAIRGHFCRCGTYPHVIDATLAAAKASGG